MREKTPGLIAPFSPGFWVQQIAPSAGVLIIVEDSPARQLGVPIERLSETEEKLCLIGKLFLFQLSQLPC